MSLVLGCFLLAMAFAIGCSHQRSNVPTSAEPGWNKVEASGDIPSPRLGHSMVYEPTTDRVIMFGGSAQSDTWAYDPKTQTWAELHPTGELPGPRMEASMAYDPTSGRMVMFGGVTLETPYSYFNDTWTFDPATDTWQQMKPSGELPEKRGGASLAYDPCTRSMVLYGGAYGPGYDPKYSDTWRYELAGDSWTHVKTPVCSVPEGRVDQVMVSTPETGRLVVFGGYSGHGAGDYRDTWEYDAASNVWTEIVPTGVTPSPSPAMGAVYDLKTRQMILLVATVSSSVAASSWGWEVWTYDSLAAKWARVPDFGSTAPSRARFEAVYDSKRAEIIVFGGVRDGEPLNDTWVLRVEI